MIHIGITILVLAAAQEVFATPPSTPSAAAPPHSAPTAPGPNILVRLQPPLRAVASVQSTTAGLVVDVVARPLSPAFIEEENRREATHLKTLKSLADAILKARVNQGAHQ